MIDFSKIPPLNTDDPLLPMNLAKTYQEFIYEKSYWQVGDLKFANKIDAIIETKKQEKSIEFHIDPRWASIDFSKVPKESSLTLCKERAAQIRRSYDHVRLLMGAGWDTHTVVRAFYEAGAKIDELVINRKFIISPTDLCCFEETHVVSKLIDHYKDFFKDTKITIIDTDWKIFDKFYSDVNFMRYHFSTQIEFHSGVTGYNPYYFCPELLEPFHEGKKAVNVMGTEKPRILKALNSYWYVMCDKDFKVSAPGHLDFFRDIDLPELAIAESHALLNQKLKNIPLYEAIKEIRFPIPESSWNDMVHKLPSKYFPLRKHQENNKGVAMAMEASLHPETKGLHQKWIDNIQFWVDLFPEWFPENWIPGKWLIGTTVGAFSLEKPLAYKYTTLEALHKKDFPNEPMSADIHLIKKSSV